jgi:hypothetical protein
MKRMVITFFMVFFMFFHPLFGDTDHLVTLSTIKARSLSVGGAFVSVQDDLASLDFNPAAFSIAPVSERVQVSLFLNPLGSLLVVKNQGNYSDWTTPVGWIVRGGGISLGKLNVGFLWGEETLNNEKGLKRSDFFDASFYEWQNNASFGFSLALAPRVSLGMAGELFFRNIEKKEIKFGHRYGMILHPRSNLSFGLCYFDFPNECAKDRMVLERIGDETLNIGISYSPWKPLTLMLDVRNVSDDGKGIMREPHMGLEMLPLKHIALRGGFFRDRESDENTYSLGVGILNWNSILPGDRFFSHPTFSLNAAMLWQQNNQLKARWFLLSCVVRI